MTRIDPFAKTSYLARAEAAGFALRLDDFSVQGRHEADPMFWLRIDRDESRWVRITDLSPSRIASTNVALVLAAALEAIDHPNRSDLYLADIGSGDTADLDRRLSNLRAAIAAYAKLQRRFVLSWHAEGIGQKAGWRVKIGA